MLFFRKKEASQEVEENTSGGEMSVTQGTDPLYASINAKDKLLWMRNVTAPEVSRQWDEAYRLVSGLLGKLSDDYIVYMTDRSSLALELRAIRKEWLSVDRTLVSEREAVILYDVLHRDIPQLAKFLGAVRAEWNSGSSKRALLAEINKKVGDAKRSTLNAKAQADAETLIRYQREKAVSAVEMHQSPNINGQTWPTFSEILPDTVKTKLATLQGLWTSQIAVVTDIKDEFLLERIASNYVPSSVNLYEMLMNGEEETHKVAEESLLSQLVLVEKHLRELSARTVKDQLNSQKAQTEFLKTRLN